jgi:hypothetical protein
LITRFTNVDGIYIEFRIVSRVVGSSVAGPTIADDNQVTTVFRVVYIEQTVSEGCKSNTLSNTGLIASLTERTSEFTYTVKDKDQTPDVLNIQPIVISSNVAGCSTTTVLEYLEPMGDYVEVQEKSSHITFNYDGDGKLLSVDFQTMMDWYIEDLVEKFGQYTASGALPNDVQIECRFATFDDIDSTKVKYDYFTLTITGTSETEDDFCDFSGLSLNLPMSGDRTWQVPDTGEYVDPMEIWISTTLAGTDTLPSNCQGLIYMTIDIEINSDLNRWETVADEWDFYYGSDTY